jgi:CheY-like chemotaxis protein
LAAGAAASANGAKPREPVLLLIDDEDVPRYLLRQLLDARYRIVEAKSGREGIEQAHSLCPDAIFLDLNMPEVNGFEVLAQLQAAASTRDIPIVLVTGQKLDTHTQAELGRSTAAFLAKDVLARAEGIALDFGPPFKIVPRYPGPSGD